MRASKAGRLFEVVSALRRLTGVDMRRAKEWQAVIFAGWRCCSIALMSTAMALLSTGARADEGGVSLWLPGVFGSLAAVPQQPGWSLATIYYHTSVSAGADVARAREFEIGRIPVNFSGTVNASLDAKVDLG